MSFFDRGSRRAVVDVRALLDESTREYVADLVALGVLVSVGLSRDGGALSVTLTSGGEWVREWFREHTDLVEWLADAHRELTQELAVPPTDNGHRKRPSKRL